MNLSQTNLLFEKYIAGTITPREWDELLAAVAMIPEEDAEALSQPLYALWQKAAAGQLSNNVPPFDKEKLYRAVTGDEKPEVSDDAPVRRIQWWRIAAAAVLIGAIVTVGMIFMNRSGKNDEPPIAKVPDDASKILPGKDRALLILDDGKQIVLDTAANGTISQQGNIKVINLNGQLAYQKDKGAGSTEVTYNTVSTARANQYQLVLLDGTKVWLNASSSIKFPTVFNGDTRTVAITGEAYFEVVHDKTKPFHVQVNGTDIEVLGTHFNVNSYSDEAVVKTSLLEGSVRITSGGKSGQLAPGQEADVTSSGNLTVRSGNVDMSIAWVKGYFQFDQAPLPVIMRQISRWYDIDIKYEGAVPDRVFKGKIQRSLPLSGIINLLTKGDIKCRLEGKTLVIGG